VKILDTAIPALRLRELTPADATGYHALVQRNAAHLTVLGDYEDAVAATAEDFAAWFAEPTDIPSRFGLHFDNRLVGRVDLIPVDPPNYGIGYWLSRDETGKGLATTAVEAVLDYAAAELNGTDVYAGVTHGNKSSEALLTRLGFTQVADFDTYSRFHKALSSPRTENGS
jgi:RimJ/RimL family protein N-acetyltransferase